MPSETTNEGAECLRVYAENERLCGRFGIAQDLDNAADNIDRLIGVLRLIAGGTVQSGQTIAADALSDMQEAESNVR
jgi:hypothetical protein